MHWYCLVMSSSNWLILYGLFWGINSPVQFSWRLKLYRLRIWGIGYTCALVHWVNIFSKAKPISNPMLIFRWYHMMTSSNGNIFRATGPFCGNLPVTGQFPSQRPVTRSFEMFFDMRLNKRLSEQSRRWWFETPSSSLWRHCNEHNITTLETENLHDDKFVVTDGHALTSIVVALSRHNRG